MKYLNLATQAYELAFVAFDSRLRNRTLNVDLAAEVDGHATNEMQQMLYSPKRDILRCAAREGIGPLLSSLRKTDSSALHTSASRLHFLEQPSKEERLISAAMIALRDLMAASYL